MNKQKYLYEIQRELAKLNDFKLMVEKKWKWDIQHKELTQKLAFMINWVDSPMLQFGCRYETEEHGVLWWVYPATMTDDQILKDLEEHGVEIEGSGLGRVPIGERILTNVLVYRHTKRKVLALQNWELNI